MNKTSVGSMMKKKNLKPWPNGKCLATKHDQTLFGNQACWCCWVAQRYQIYLNEQNVFSSNVCGDQSNVSRCSNFYQTRSNTIKMTMKRGVQINGKSFVTKQCVIVYGHLSFPVWLMLSVQCRNKFGNQNKIDIYVISFNSWWYGL